MTTPLCTFTQRRADRSLALPPAPLLLRMSSKNITIGSPSTPLPRSAQEEAEPSPLMGMLSPFSPASAAGQEDAKESRQTLLTPCTRGSEADASLLSSAASKSIPPSPRSSNLTRHPSSPVPIFLDAKHYYGGEEEREAPLSSWGSSACAGSSPRDFDADDEECPTSCSEDTNSNQQHQTKTVSFAAGRTRSGSVNSKGQTHKIPPPILVHPSCETNTAAAPNGTGHHRQVQTGTATHQVKILTPGRRRPFRASLLPEDVCVRIQTTSSATSSSYGLTPTSTASGATAAILSREEILASLRTQILQAFPDVLPSSSCAGTTASSGRTTAMTSSSGDSFELEIEREEIRDGISAQILVESRVPRFVKSPFPGRAEFGMARDEVHHDDREEQDRYSDDADDEEEEYEVDMTIELPRLRPSTTGMEISPLCLASPTTPKIWDLSIPTASLFANTSPLDSLAASATAAAAYGATSPSIRRVRIAGCEDIITCTRCSGKTRSQCQLCHGIPPDHCGTCSGAGKNCVPCRGKGFTACRRCHGSGYTRCRKCDGQGKYSAELQVEVHHQVIELPLSPVEHFAASPSRFPISPTVDNGSSTTMASRDPYNVLSPIAIIENARAQVAEIAAQLEIQDDAQQISSTPLSATCTWQSTTTRLVSVRNGPSVRAFQVPECPSPTEPIREVSDERETMELVQRQIADRRAAASLNCERTESPDTTSDFLQPLAATTTVDEAKPSPLHSHFSLDSESVIFAAVRRPRLTATTSMTESISSPRGAKQPMLKSPHFSPVSFQTASFEETQIAKRVRFAAPTTPNDEIEIPDDHETTVYPKSPRTHLPLSPSGCPRIGDVIPHGMWPFKPILSPLPESAPGSATASSSMVRQQSTLPSPLAQRRPSHQKVRFNTTTTKVAPHPAQMVALRIPVSPGGYI